MRGLSEWDLHGIAIAQDLLSPSLISRLIAIHSLDPSLFSRLIGLVGGLTWRLGVPQHVSDVFGYGCADLLF